MLLESTEKSTHQCRDFFSPFSDVSSFRRPCFPQQFHNILLEKEKSQSYSSPINRDDHGSKMSKNTFSGSRTTAANASQFYPYMGSALSTGSCQGPKLTAPRLCAIISDAMALIDEEDFIDSDECWFCIERLGIQLFACTSSSLRSSTGLFCLKRSSNPMATITQITPCVSNWVGSNHSFKTTKLFRRDKL